MPPPTVYSEITFAEYLHQALGATAEALGFDPSAGSYAEVVNETLLAYGELAMANITGAANLKKLRALGRLEAWRAVVAQTAGDFAFEADGGKYNRSEIHKMALENLAKAESEAAQYDTSLRVGIDSVNYIHDPYKYLSEDERPE